MFVRDIFVFCVTAVGDHLLVHAQDITTLGMVASRRESFSKEELVRPDLSNIGEDILLRVHTHTAQPTNKTTKDSQHKSTNVWEST